LGLWEEDQVAGIAPAKSFEPLKRFFKIYVRDFPGAGEMRAKMMEAKSVEDVRGILDNRMIS